MNVKLKYFKRTGRYYGEARYKSNKDVQQLSSEVREMNENGKLPELNSGRWDGYILVEVENKFSVLVFAFI